MPSEATSQHLRNAHELLLLVPLKIGNVQYPERITSYASRLRATLELMFKPTQNTLERTLMPAASPIDSLQNLYHFHYGVVDHLERPYLMLSATFDSSWETYFHNLVDQVGHFLDAIFCHCEGFEGRSCADGYEAFAGFVREHQVQSGILYSAQADLTVDDIRLLRKVAQGRALDEPLQSAQADAASEKKRWLEQGERLQREEFQPKRARDYQRLALSMYDVRELFPEVQEIKGRTARSIYEKAAGQLWDTALDQTETSLVAAIGVGLPAGVNTWLKKIKPVPGGSLPKRTAALEPEELEQIQGNILQPYPKSEHGLMVLMQIVPGQSRSELSHVLDTIVTTANEQWRGSWKSQHRVNVAFTFAGLRRMGLNDAVLDLFPKEFREGMEGRAGVLGDIGFPNHPDDWQDQKRNYPFARSKQEEAGTFGLADVDFVLLIQAQREPLPGDHLWQPEHPLCDALKETVAKLERQASVLRVEPLRRSKKDHFGLPNRDNAESQPTPCVQVAGEDLVVHTPSRAGKFDNEIALGELLLGYPDKRAQTARCADDRFNSGSAALFKNGSFLVVRKLSQDSEAFEQFLTCASRGSDKEHVRSSLSGRDQKGHPLAAPASDHASQNDFDYESDPRGDKCPLHAHMRRANPRTETTPRIVRRSFSYGPDFVAGKPSEERGLMFMAYNANIAEQYEVIQRWISGGNSTGLLSTRGDLLGGGQPAPNMKLSAPHGDPRGVLTAPQAPVVSLCWGMYLFVPSRRALSFLALQSALPGASEGMGQTEKSTYDVQQPPPGFGARLLKKLDAIKDPEQARSAWKQVLEEGSYSEDADAIWEEIRKHGQPYPTPYGVLIADLDVAREILCDDGRNYSVRRYWHRLRKALGEHYLAMDVTHPASDAKSTSEDDRTYGGRLNVSPSYDDLACEPNKVMRELFTFESGYALAREAAVRFLRAHPIFDVRDLAKYVVAFVAREWFDLPEDHSPYLQETRDLLQNFIVLSRFTFFPYPEPWQHADVQKAGQALMRASLATPELKSPMALRLKAAGYRTETDIRVAMLGALVGFVPAAVAHIAQVLVRWFDDGDLNALANVASKLGETVAKRALFGQLLKTMAAYPVPTILYRTALEGSRFAPGTTVVIGLQAVAFEAQRRRSDKPEKWLFGGAPRGESPAEGTTHGCPAREPSLGIFSGALTAVVSVAPLTRESPVRFSHTSSQRSDDEAEDHPLVVLGEELMRNVRMGTRVFINTLRVPSFLLKASWRALRSR